MLEVTYEPDQEQWPGSSVRMKPATAALDWQIQMAVALNRPLDVQKVFGELVTDWTEAPYFAKHKGRCTTFDKKEISELDPGFLFDVCAHARELAQLTEEELKNLQSQST